MDTAAKVLIVGGVLLLAYSFITGYIIGVVRAKAATTPKYLVLAHTEPLMQGTMLLALVWAVQLSDFAGGVETVAALLLVVAAMLQGGKELLNWRQGIEDEFQEKPLGYWVARIQSTMASVGLLILVAGVLTSL